MKDRLLFDTNVVLDHLLDRSPFATDVMALWSMAERRELVGMVSAISFNFVYSIVPMPQTTGPRLAIRAMRDVFDVIEVDEKIIAQAMDSPFADFEDAIQHACAVRGRSSHLVTRNVADFRRSDIAVVAPDAYLAMRNAKP